MSLKKVDIHWEELGFDAIETRSMFKATCSEMVNGLAAR